MERRQSILKDKKDPGPVTKKTVRFSQEANHPDSQGDQWKKRDSYFNNDDEPVDLTEYPQEPEDKQRPNSSKFEGFLKGNSKNKPLVKEKIDSRNLLNMARNRRITEHQHNIEELPSDQEKSGLTPIEKNRITIGGNVDFFNESVLDMHSDGIEDRPAEKMEERLEQKAEEQEEATLNQVSSINFNNHGIMQRGYKSVDSVEAKVLDHQTETEQVADSESVRLSDTEMLEQGVKERFANRKPKEDPEQRRSAGKPLEILEHNPDQPQMEKVIAMLDPDDIKKRKEEFNANRKHFWEKIVQVKTEVIKETRQTSELLDKYNVKDEKLTENLVFNEKIIVRREINFTEITLFDCLKLKLTENEVKWQVLAKELENSRIQPVIETIATNYLKELKLKESLYSQRKLLYSLGFKVFRMLCLYDVLVCCITFKITNLNETSFQLTTIVALNDTIWISMYFTVHTNKIWLKTEFHNFTLDSDLDKIENEEEKDRTTSKLAEFTKFLGDQLETLKHEEAELEANPRKTDVTVEQTPLFEFLFGISDYLSDDN